MEDSDQPPEHWLYKIFSRLQAQREKWQKNKPHFYYPILGLVLLAVITIHHLYDRWIDKITAVFQWGWFWGWLMRVVFAGICILVIGVLFTLDKIRCKKNGVSISWEPWLLVFAFAIVFLVFGIHGKVPQNEPLAGVAPPAQPDSSSQTSFLPTLPDEYMEQPGESAQLHVGQSLHADFANMTMKVYLIDPNITQASITFAIPNQKAETLQGYRNRPMFTNMVKDKCFVVSLSGVGCLDNPRWIKIKVEQIPNEFNSNKQ